MPQVTVEFIEVAKEMAEAIRWILRDAAYKPPEEIGEIPQRWIDRLREVNEIAQKKLGHEPGMENGLL